MNVVALLLIKTEESITKSHANHDRKISNFNFWHLMQKGNCYKMCQKTKNKNKKKKNEKRKLLSLELFCICIKRWGKASKL